MTDVKPGIYYRGEIEYDKVDAVNISSLIWMAKSAKHYIAQPRKETKALSFGTCGHAAVLEPARFARDFVAWNRRSKPDENGKTKAAPRNGQHWEDFKSKNIGKEIVTLDEYERATELRNAIGAEPESASVLEGVNTEVALVWVNRETGILCKGRIDWIRLLGRVSMGDLKTARDISPGPFFQDAAKRHYHTKMAWYSDAVAQLLDLDENPETLVLAVENGYPFDSIVYEIDDEELQIGRDEYSFLIRKLADCNKSGQFHGIANRTRMKYRIPKWATDDPEDSVDDEIDFGKDATDE
jgi:hypothetical protein